MRKPRKVRSRTQRRSSESLITAELLERRYALTATPFSDEFASAAMEAVARGEITSDRWIVHEINNLGCSNNQAFHNLSSFGGNAGWHADPIGNSFFRLRTSGISTSDVVNWARNNQDNFLFEPDLPIQVETSSNDPSLWRLYGLNNYGQAGGAPDADIDATDAWDITTGSRDVVIGVIDSGVDITHPDLAANIWVNPGETPNNGIDDDGNGFIDDVNGWDFYDDDNSPNDGNGHGTHVAGTIGAVGNNNLGITGVNWHVSLLPLRFLGNDGSGWTSDAVAAVNYATMLKRDFDINVAATNNSWGGGGYSRTLDRAIQAANDEGIMFIAAAGNQGTNNDANPSYPTNYSSPNVISVAALNRSDNLASFSNYGATTVDVGAPGVSIYSTLPGNSYGSFSGTSMAAPHVAGVVGLLNAAKPGISVTEVNNAILNTVDPLQSLDGKTLTGGRVNAASALTSLLGQLPTIEPIDNLIVSNAQSVNVPVNASDIDGDVILSLVVSESTSEAAPAAVTLDGSTITITPIEGRHGITIVSVTATDADSNTAAISFTVDTLQAIESEGAVTLNKDSFGKFYADDTPIYNSAGSQLDDDLGQWNVGGAETINGINRILIYRDSDAHYWELSSTWQYQSHSAFYAAGTSEYFDLETQFQIDINNDGTVGAPALVLESIESEGAVTLNKDSFGKFYADDTPIYNSAGSQLDDDLGQWNVGGAETINGINRILIYRDSDAHYWELSSTWQYQSHSAFYAAGTSEYFDLETQFQIDINNDGTVGAPALVLESIESEGAVTLNKDSFGKFYADDTPIYNSAGSQLDDDLGQWNVGGAETINGINRILIYRDSDAHYWELSSTWQYQSHSAFYAAGTSEYFDLETQFQIDINNDGTVGAPALVLESIESEGAVTLNKDSFGKFYADDTPIYNSAGSQLDDDLGQWNVGGAETINGINRILIYRDSDAHYWELSSTWQYQSHSAFYAAGTSEYFDLETQFQVDINNDGTIGAPALVFEAIESEGAVTLNKDSFGKFYADDTPIYNSAGSHIGEDTDFIQAEWDIGGVEVVNGTNRMLVYRSGDAHYWNLDSTWQYQSHSDFYTDGTSQYFDVETQFQVDINNDGTIGQPITKELQAFPSSILPGDNFTNLPSGYETSGLVLHQGFNKLFAVSDEGILSMMNPNGTGLVHWSLSGDFEAITVADHDSEFIYIGVENPDSIIEFDVSIGEITRTFSLTNWMTGPSNLGLEALTFVPDTTQPEGGYFHAGLQSSGTIYRFQLPIHSSTDSTAVTFIDTLQVEGNHTDISGLSYDPSSGRILALYDSINRIKVIERNGDLRTQWTAPGSEQEAIFYTQGELFIGEDFGSTAQGIITKYSPFTLIVG